MFMMFNLTAERCEFAGNLRLYGHGWDYRNFDCGVAKVMLSSAISWSGKPLTASVGHVNRPSSERHPASGPRGRMRWQAATENLGRNDLKTCR
jgi:hypothetical protein